MRLLLFLLVSTPACLSSSASRDTLVVLPGADIRVHLPRPTQVLLGTWSLAYYSSAEIYGFDITVPTVRPTSDEPTAVQARYGDSVSVIIAAVPEFLGTIDLLGRLLDLEQLRRSTRGSTPTMITGATQRLLGAAPASEISIELRDTTTKDSLFTLITSAKRSSDVAIVIVRSRRNPQQDATSSGRIYRQILASMVMENMFHRDTSHLRHPHGWMVSIPHAWANNVSTGHVWSFFQLDASEDTLWNSVTVQLPLVRVDYIVTHYNASDTAMADVIEHVAERKGLERWSPPGQPRIGKLEGLWYRVRSLRRGDTVQTTYGVFFARGWLAVIQFVAWERDMAHVGSILPDLVNLLYVPDKR